MAAQYFSMNTQAMVDISEMSDRHLENAIAVVAENRHSTFRNHGPTHCCLVLEQNARLKKVNGLLRMEADLANLLPDGRKEVSSEDLPRKKKLATTAALYKIAQHGRVSADEIRAYFTERSINMPGSVLSQVFKDRRFEKIGFKKSTDRLARGRWINVWTVKAA